MIGVAKNQNINRFDNRSRMSRKWTVSAAKKSASAAVKMSCTSTATGNHARPAGSGQWRYAITNAARIVSPRKKWTMFASTLTSGRISAGNNTFLIKFPPDTSAFDDSSSDDANQFHGR